MNEDRITGQRAGWQDIATAPRDGRPFQARIEGYGDDNIISWQWGLRDDEDRDCGGWAYMEGEPPQCWTDGWCWASNEDGKPSARPTHWLPPPDTADDITAGLEALSEPIVAEWGEVKDRLNLGKEELNDP